METAIINSNKRKFQQSFGTPFYNYPYNKLFGYKGLIPASQKVLDGNYQPPVDVTCHMKDFLFQLATPQSIKENPCSMDITLASFISVWKKGKKNITCYPSK
jgi:hypothetical protein